MVGNSRFLGATAALAVLFALSFSPSEAAIGKIAGRVLDAETGAALPDANVALVDTRLGAVAAGDGRFFVLNIPPGVYTVKVSYVGYSTYTLEGVRVSADLTTDLEVKLTSSDLEVEEVVVQAERPIIDKNATNAVRIVGGQDLEILPLRGVQNVLSLQPGVVNDEGSIHIRGSRSDEVGYYVEGANVRNIVTGGTAVSLIDEALEEIQLQAGGFNAEYGGANAAIILQELRTGGAEWDVNFLAETDNITSSHEQRFGTYSYGYNNQVLTLSGPLAGNRKIRAFLAGQRGVRDFVPIFWDGFEFADLVDSGDRGGRIHWGEDEDGNAVQDTINSLVLGPGNIDHTGLESIAFNGTLLFDYNPLQLRVTSLYTMAERELNPAPIRNMLNRKRLPEYQRVSGLTNVKATHILDPSMFYELNFSLYRQDREIYDGVFKDNFMVYNDSVAVARADAAFTPYTAQGAVPRPYDLNGFPFNRRGTPTSTVTGTSRSSSYSKEDDRYWGLAGSITKQTTVHQLKAGFDYQRWTSRRYGIVLGSIRSAIKNTYPNLDAVYQRFYAGEIEEGEILDELIEAARSAPAGQGDLENFKALIRNTSRADFFGFDEFGREVEDEGLEGPRYPVLAAAFVQDKIEYNDLILNLGLRWEYFDADSWRFKNQAAPVRDDKKFTLDTDFMQKTRTFQEISPRLGFSFPVSDITVFHVQYGRFSQMPSMRSMFAGGARLALELGGQNYIAFPTAFDIEPMRTTQYELGFEHQFTASASFDITGFYRDVKGQLQLRRQDLEAGAVGANAFNYLQNGDFATTKGLEFVFKLRRTNRLRTELNYTLSDARGTGSTTFSAVSGVENDGNLPTIISPLDFNEAHNGNIYLDYRFDRNDGGPVLQRLGANLLLQFSSGHNFTLVGGSLGQTGPEEGGILNSFDPRNRKPLEAINSSTTPWTFQADLRVDKGFDLFGTEAQVYVRVINLFNRRNVINVYGRTGNDKDDGFLTDPDLSSQIVEASGGLEYQQLYEAINITNRQHYWANEGWLAGDGDIYDEPRQLRVGLKLGF